MVKISRGQVLANSIKEVQVRFFNMSEDERIEFISRYDKMQPYQKVALRSCRKFMSAKEKQAFRLVTSQKDESLVQETEPEK